jgi:hypothetical protein
VRRFRIYRPNAPEGHLATGAANPADEVQLEGCVFSDGTVSIRWQTQFRSFSNWGDWATFDAVHGHPEYGTIVEWLDGENGEPLYRTMEPSPPEYVRAFTLLMDLDRCVHGRHRVDSCLMCPNGKSAGNLWVFPGATIGHTVRGDPVVVPDPQSEDWHDPAKWIRSRS